MLWVSSRAFRNSATIRSSCQRVCEERSGPLAAICGVGGISRFICSSSSHMRQRNAHLGKEIEIGVVVDLDILAVPVDKAGQPMRQIHAQQAADDNRVRISLDDFLDL